MPKIPTVVQKIFGDKMSYRNKKFRRCPAFLHGLRSDERLCCGGLTIVEMIIALAIMTIIFAAVLPQFRVIQNGWDSKRVNSELIQNGRILIDHINRNLSKAVQITAVSQSYDTGGYINFANYDGDVSRYDISSANNYVEFGAPGSLSCLAGPAGLLQFTCYDACDLNTPITDVNLIRIVKVDATIIDSESSGRDKTFTTWVYLRTNANAGCGIAGCWKLDEASGLTAADSSGSGHDGTLINMAGDEWTGGVINRGLAFDGTNDGVDCGNNNGLNLDAGSWGGWVRLDEPKKWAERIIFKENSGGTGICELFDWNGFKAEVVVGGLRYRASSPSSTNTKQWYHVFATYDEETLRLYVDGQEVASNASPSGTIDDNAGPLGLGTAVTDATFAPFYGMIDDVRVYNRALSADEVAELANTLRYRDIREYKTGYYLTSVYITTPPSNVGDLLITAVATDGDTTLSLVPVNAGWTLISLDDYDGAVTLGVWYKIVGSSEPSYHPFTWSGSRQAYGWMMRFTGHNPVKPINAHSVGGESSITPTSPAVTTTVNNCLILRLGAFDDDDVVTTPEPGNPGLLDHTAITMDKSADSNMPNEYGGFSEAKLDTDGISITIPKPDDTAAGDFLLAAVATDGATYDSLAPSLPATGWSTITTLPGGSPPTAVTLRAWHRTAGASEPNDYSFSWAGGEQAYGWIVRLVGTNLRYGAWASPIYSNTPRIDPPCGPSYVGPTGVGNVITVRLGAFDGDAINIDVPGLADHNDITMDRSNTGDGSISGGSGYMEHTGNGPASNFWLTVSEAYWTASPCIAPTNCYTNTCSGGAGYIRQAMAGNSGTSNFALDRENEAAMLTIAIAPAAGDDYCCGGQLQP
ncbi:MAG: LamG domain-containing protein [Phycisphaerae bacterium]|nr:LamG domain-containing protein [Phycisphaerae bacterium]